MNKHFLFLLPLLCACTSNNVGNSDKVSESSFDSNSKAENIQVNNVVNEAETSANQNEEDDNYILIPGETYYTTKEVSSDNYGNSTKLTVELIAYIDGTFSGQVIETTVLGHRPEEPNIHTYPIEGEWIETSKHDRRYMYVEFELVQSGQEFDIYIDENHNVYMNDLSSAPEKLYIK